MNVIKLENFFFLNQLFITISTDEQAWQIIRSQKLLILLHLLFYFIFQNEYMQGDAFITTARSPLFHINRIEWDPIKQ